LRTNSTGTSARPLYVLSEVLLII